MVTVYQTAGMREIPKESESCTILAGGMYVYGNGMTKGYAYTRVCRGGSVSESHSCFETNSETEVARGWRSAAASLWREKEVSIW